MVDLTDEHDVVEVAAAGSPESDAELDEHASPIMLRCHDQHGIGRHHRVQFLIRTPPWSTVPSVDAVEEGLKAYYAGEMKTRASRPLDDNRTERVLAFTEYLRAARAQSLLEVGCGAGRDGLILGESGCTYTGVDLSPTAVQICRDRGLDAVEATAVDLPFGDESFDAAWSMSTLMHLPGDGFDQAIQELGRVVRRGGTAEIGVWGHTSSRDWTSPDGRYFNHRSDEQLQDELRVLGDVVAFDTWSWFEDGGHYQWARVAAR